MNKVFDKLKPIFEANAANKYVSAIRDGFIACMPVSYTHLTLPTIA